VRVFLYVNSNRGKSDPGNHCNRCSPATQEATKEHGKQRRKHGDIETTDIKPKWMWFFNWHALLAALSSPHPSSQLQGRSESEQSGFHATRSGLAGAG
jgi:hypothetical protein